MVATVVLENNLPVLFVNAGGDWESPICFIIYWDGKSLRGYVPTKGNVFNKKTKAAYGNEYDFDQEEIDDESVPDANPSEIYGDILNRIIIK